MNIQFSWLGGLNVAPCLCSQIYHHRTFSHRLHKLLLNQDGGLLTWFTGEGQLQAKCIIFFDFIDLALLDTVLFYPLGGRKKRYNAFHHYWRRNFFLVFKVWEHKTYCYSYCWATWYSHFHISTFVSQFSYFHIPSLHNLSYGMSNISCTFIS